MSFFPSFFELKNQKIFTSKCSLISELTTLDANFTHLEAKKFSFFSSKKLGKNDTFLRASKIAKSKYFIGAKRGEKGVLFQDFFTPKNETFLRAENLQKSIHISQILLKQKVDVFLMYFPLTKMIRKIHPFFAPKNSWSHAVKAHQVVPLAPCKHPVFQRADG